MNGKLWRPILGACAAALLLLAGCSNNGASNGGTNGTPSGTGMVNTIMQDAPSDDWAAVDVKVLSIALVPQGGGTPVTVYTAPNPAPVLNLVDLDNLGEILNSASVPAGTYTAAIVTISANPGDVTLTVANNPETGFAGAGMAGQAIPPNQIQIQGAKGASGGQTVSFTVNLVTPLTVSANSTNALDLEVDLSHPAFLVAHWPAGLNPTILWAVNFNGPVHHHPIADLRRLVLRDLYGSLGANAVSSNGSTLTITKVYPVEPPTTPETSVSTPVSLPIQVDSTNGTIVYDVDAKTHNTVTSFSTDASIFSSGRFVRVAARYQVDGTLVAVRVWVANAFNSVWLSPEGHVLHVNSSTDTITVQNELGMGVPILVDGNTQFFFRAPSNPAMDAAPICTGTACLTQGVLERGFKVHVSVDDPLAAQLTAQTVDIEYAAFGGTISSPTTLSFDYTSHYATVGDNYTNLVLDYISSQTPNGHDPLTGAAISGFKWWNLAFPTLVQSGTNAIPNFISATNGTASFGNTVPSIQATGISNGIWGDPANATGWAANWTILTPVPVPPAPLGAGTVVTGWTTLTGGGDFTMSANGGTQPVTINVSDVSGSAALVYQVDRTGAFVTVSPVDITTPGGLATVQQNLVTGTLVKVYGIPTPAGAVQAYTLFYYTGMAPTAVQGP